jgi:hypothetical protein
MSGNYNLMIRCLQCCGARTIFCGSGSDFSESFVSTLAPAPAPVLHAIRHFMTKENVSVDSKKWMAMNKNTGSTVSYNK